MILLTLGDEFRPGLSVDVEMETVIAVGIEWGMLRGVVYAGLWLGPFRLTVRYWRPIRHRSDHTAGKGRW